VGAKAALVTGAAAGASELGGRAWVASALLHVSVAAAVVAHGQAATPSVTDARASVPTTTEEIPAPPVVDEMKPDDVPLPQPVVPHPPMARPATHPVAVRQPALTEPKAAALDDAAREGAHEPSPVVAGPSGAPTFVMSLPVGSFGRAPAVAPATDEVLDERGVSVRAEVAYGPPPVYPAEATAAQVELDVPVEIVVDATGRVISARVTRRVGYGFEASATEAVQRYRFKPAQRDGRAVAVRMLWTMQYRLR
jgi:TonB family protein